MKTPFEFHAELFRAWALGSMLKSPEYSGIRVEFNSSLVLADRILEAFAENVEFSQIRKIPKALLDLAQAVDRKDEVWKETEALLQASEQWLKPILYLVYPNRWASLNSNKKSFTLFPTIRELDLLTQAELDTSENEASTINDEVRRLIFWHRKDRNYVTHETAATSPDVHVRFLSVALTTFLAPVYKHREAIKSALRELIASPLPSKEIENFLTLLNSERLKHLERFCGREQWIEELVTKLSSESNSSKPYFVLVGHEGIGKSAICAKLTDALSSNLNILGRHAEAVRKVAPWLPNVLLHFGKQSNQQHEIVGSLIAQANTLLLASDPIPLIAEDQSSGIEMKLLGSRLSTSQRRNDPSYFQDAKESSSLSDTYNPYSVIAPNLKQQNATANAINYRRALYLTLEKVSEERGPVVLLIDAVDEISGLGSDLEWLPERLPRRVSALLTGRQNTRAVEWLTNNREIEKLRLTGLQRGEIPLFTRIDSNSGAAEARFNERVWHVSHGWPVLVLAAAASGQHHLSDLDNTRIDTSVDSVFARQASEWEDKTELLQKILMLLSIFEPATPLDLSYLQSYLQSKGTTLSLAEVRKILKPVAAQIEGLGVGRIKLSLQAFGEYVRTRYSSKKDLKQGLTVVCDWLGTEVDIDVKTITPFLEHWLNPEHVPDEGMRKIVESVVDHIVVNHNAKFLYEIYLLSRDKKLRTDLLLPFARRCLVASAEASDVRAMRALAVRLIDGVGMNKDAAQGEVWLRRAAQLEDTDAMVDLGWRLVHGDGLSIDRIEGEHCLRKAMNLGSSLASIMLAIELLDGTCQQIAPNEGEELLRSLASNHDITAMLVLSDRLIRGKGIPKNWAEGRLILEKLATEGHTVASHILALVLLNAEGAEKNIAEGESWLRTAAAGDPDAERELALRLLDGRDLQKNMVEGEQLLRRIAHEGDTEAMRVLGVRLLDGYSVPQNAREGEHWLRRAVEGKNLIATGDLALRLIDGRGLARKQHEGLTYLRKAAELEDVRSRRILGYRLLEGKGLTKNLKEGERWLRAAAEDGDIDSMTALGTRLAEGRGLSQNKAEGEQWLRKAAATDDPNAMIALAMHLSSHGEIQSFEAEELATRAFEAGNAAAGVLIGRLLYGRGDNSSAAQTFAKANKLGAPLAAVNLSYMVRRGEIPSELVVPPIADLLAQGISEKEVFAVINGALAIAAGIENPSDWVAADNLMATLKNYENPDEALNWWYQKLVPEGDAEGHLVVGWLARHGLIKDPDGMTVAERMDQARSGTWRVPQWMNDRT